MKKKRLLIIAGEASGDMHASELICHLKHRHPRLEIFGLGGQNMRRAGCRILYDITRLAVVGFVEVLAHYNKFRSLFKRLVELLDKKRPDLVVLVDYPGFNLRFAGEAKKRGIPVVYYISPQVWAWGEGRIARIRRLVDRIIVIFGFEEELYKKAGMKVNFVGHPFLDTVRPSLKKEDLIKRLHISHRTKKVAIFPGSREVEVKRHLPVMLAACERIAKEMPGIEFIVSRRKEVLPEIYNSALLRSRIKPHSLENMPYEIMEIADLVIVSSGSATLESAIMGCPMVILYKTSPLTYAIVKNMIKIPDIGLVNIVAGKRIVPEFVQSRATPRNIADAAIGILSDPRREKKIKEGLMEVKSRLGSPGASGRAAQIIERYLS